MPPRWNCNRCQPQMPCEILYGSKFHFDQTPFQGSNTGGPETRLRLARSLNSLSAKVPFGTAPSWRTSRRPPRRSPSLNSLSAKVPFGAEGPSGHGKYCSKWACLKGGRFSSVFRDAGRDCSGRFQDLYRHVSEQQAGRNLRLKAEAGFRRFRRALQIPTGAPRHVPVDPEAPSRPSTEKETAWQPSPKGETSPSPVRPPAADGSRTCRLPELQGLERAGVPDCKHFH